MKRFENKVALITGGTAGIGAAASQKFVEEGAKVIVWARNAEKGEKFAKENNLTFMKVNVGDYNDVERATKEVVEKFGKIDILINNAGVTKDASIKKMTKEQWDDVIEINLTSVFNCVKHVSPIMLDNGWGRIINVSSVVGLYGNFGQTNYVATKAGIIGMTKTLCRELGKKGITVNAVAPGFIATEMVEAMPENVLDAMKAKVPMGRLGDPKEIANVYAFLASDEASYVNGAIFSVDGGLTV